MKKKCSTYIFQGDNLIDGVILVIENRLYRRGWNLIIYLLQYLSNKELFPDARLVICQENNSWNYVACATTSGKGLTMAFTKRRFRRKGYGSQCVKALKLNENDFAIDGGIRGAHLFWAKNGINVV